MPRLPSWPRAASDHQEAASRRGCQARAVRGPDHSSASWRTHSGSRADPTGGDAPHSTGAAAFIQVLAAVCACLSSQGVDCPFELLHAHIRRDTVSTSCLVHREEAIINVFESNTYSVANIFDVTLRVRAETVIDLIACVTKPVP